MKFKEFWKQKIWSPTVEFWNKHLKDPKGIGLVLFYMFSVLVIAGTLVLVILHPAQTVFHYICYCIAAVCLTYVMYTIVIFAPRIKAKIIETLKKHKFTNELLTAYGYRTFVFSILSFIFNVGYVAIIGTFGIISRSVWYISISVYYLTLIFMKGNIYFSRKRYNTELKKARAYRFCGIVFIFLTLALSGIIVLIYTSNMYFEYAGMLIFVFAAFTFYKLTFAIINIFKARKHDNLYIQSIRNVNLASSLVSIIVLQVAMFQAFAPELNKGIANGLTGAGVSIIILALGIYMICKANKEIKQLTETLVNDNNSTDKMEVSNEN